MPSPSSAASLQQALHNITIVSLAQNLPGPAALQRLHAMGAQCYKIEARPASGQDTSDPMAGYCRNAYEELHQGIERKVLNLKTKTGLATLHRLLKKSDVLLTAFRPAALQRLGLDWVSLSAQHPQLNMVRIVGQTGAGAEQAGHDLTYMAEAGLLANLETPPTLFADMTGALLASEAVLHTLIAREQNEGAGVEREIALHDAACWLALPHHWGAVQPQTELGGASAAYRLYACQDGRVALAALEPHFVNALFRATGLAESNAPDFFYRAETHQALSAFFARHTCAQIQALGEAHDLPLAVLPPANPHARPL